MGFIIGLLIGLTFTAISLLVAIYFQVRGIKVIERIVREVEKRGTQKPQMVEIQKDREESVKKMLNVQEDEILR